jgi:hypothetical protein
VVYWVAGFWLPALEHGGDALSSADTHGFQAELGVSRFHLV